MALLFPSLPEYDYVNKLNKLAQYVNSVTLEGALGDGSTDDSVALQAAIDAAAAAGGGVLRFPVIGTSYNHATTLIPKDNVILDLGGAKLKYTGSSQQFASSTSGVLTGFAVINGRLDSGTASKTFELFSPYACRVEHVVVAANSSSSVVIDIKVNTTGGTNASSNRNAAFSYFGNVTQTGTCGTMVKLTGNSTTPTVGTLCTFHAINADGCAVRGIEVNSWADNVTFSGMQRYSLTANSGVGLEVNSGTPGSNVGTYSIIFDTLAIDTLGALTGRVAVKINYCKLVKIGALYNSPEAEGGVVVASANATGYDIWHHKDSTGTLIHYCKNSTQAFLAKISSAQTFTGAKTKADFTTEVVDAQGNYDSSTSQFTAPVTGIYKFNLNMINTTGVTAADIWIFTIEATGSSTQTFRTTRYVPANTTGAVGVELTTPPIELVVGDVVQSYVTRSAGAGNFVQLNDGTFNFFGGERIH